MGRGEGKKGEEGEEGEIDKEWKSERGEEGKGKSERENIHVERGGGKGEGERIGRMGERGSNRQDGRKKTWRVREGGLLTSQHQ